MIISSMLGRTNVPSRPDARRAGGDLAGRRVPSRLLLAIAVVLVAATGSLAAGKAHEGFFIGRDGEFEADADANVYAGPAPLAVKFSASAQHASGRVTYRWNFDDGTTSAEQNPSHGFRRHGWYNVTMEARDAAGHVYRMNLLLHAWRPKDWARLQAHQDVRIMRHAARELERKRSREAAASGMAPSANDASAGSGSTAPH